MMENVEKFKPSVSKHNLLFIAGLAWTTAGGILAGRGLSYLLQHGEHLALCLAGGLLSILWFESLKLFKQKWWA